MIQVSEFDYVQELKLILFKLFPLLFVTKILFIYYLSSSNAQCTRFIIMFQIFNFFWSVDFYSLTFNDNNQIKIKAVH